MPTKKVSRKRVAVGAPSETPWGRSELLFEEIKGEIRLLHEAFASHREETQRQRAEDLAQIYARLDIIESVVRQNSADIVMLKAAVIENSHEMALMREDIKRNSEDIKRNSEDIKRNSEDIKQNSEDIKRNSEDIEKLRRELARVGFLVEGAARADAVANLERRVSILEDRVGIAQPA